jgi:hypothetical protein
MTLNTRNTHALVFNHARQIRFLDLDGVKAGTGLLEMVQRDTRMSKKCAQEWSGPCPFCGGRDRFSVNLKRDKWFCRGCGEGYWHDAIDYVCRRDNVSTAEAIKSLEGEQSSVKTRAPKTDIDRVKWISRGMRFIEDCHHTLYSKEGRRALRYLHNRRGLTDQTIDAWRLGFNSVNRYDQADVWGTKDNVWLARGIVIPCFPDRLRSIKIRRSKNDPGPGPNYIQVKGSKNWLFGAESFVNCMQAFLFEGELDALLAWQEWGGVGLGFGAFPAGKNFSLQWFKYVVGIEMFFVAHDMDKAGRDSATKLAEFSDRMIPISFPMGNDLGEFFEQGGNVFEWIYDSLGSVNDR